MTEPSPLPGRAGAGELLGNLRRWRLFRAAAALLAIAVCLFGIGLHLAIRDQYALVTTVLYYAMPRPLLACAATLAVVFARKTSRALWRIALLLAVGLWGSVLLQDVAWNPARAVESPRLRIAVWNAANLSSGRAAAAAEIASWNCDIVGLVEAGGTRAADLQMWKTLLQDYDIQTNRSGMLFLSRRPLMLQPVIRLGPKSDAIRADFEFEGRACSVWLVDVASAVKLARRPILERLTTEVRSSSDQPQVLLGDFNTPPGSAAFHDLRTEFRQAFETAGQGYSPTWPVPCPVLTLDMIWVNAGWEVGSCELGWTGLSDHRPVVTTLTIATVAPGS